MTIIIPISKRFKRNELAKDITPAAPTSSLSHPHPRRPHPICSKATQVREDVGADMSARGEVGCQLSFQLCLLVIVLLLGKGPYTHKYLAATEEDPISVLYTQKQARVPARVARQAGD